MQQMAGHALVSDGHINQAVGKKSKCYAETGHSNEILLQL